MSHVKEKETQKTAQSIKNNTTVARIDRPDKPKEIGGKEGPDPIRYGDWENNGIASDF